MMLQRLFLLLIAHAVTDYALQPPNVALGKNRFAGPPPGYEPSAHGKILPVWPMVMAAHALINAGGVYVVTGDITFACIEFVLHFAIDFGKCEKTYNGFVDQALHLSTKLMYAAAGGF